MTDKLKPSPAISRRDALKLGVKAGLPALVLAACGPKAGGFVDSLTQTPSLTPTPSLFPTETDTPTATKIMPPAEFLAQIQVNPDRTYTMVDNYYVDSYTTAKWAVLENGTWRATTPEEKYGHLAPLSPDKPYQEPNTWGIGDNLHSGDRNYKTYILSAIWTGDIVERQVMNEGVSVTEIDGIFVMRDLSGKMVQLKVRLHSPEVTGEFFIYVKRQISENTTQTAPEFGEPTDLLPVGKQIELSIYYQAPGNAIVASYCNPTNGSCTDEYNAGLRQFWEQQAGAQEFIDALRAGEDVPENVELVLIPDLIVKKQ